MWAIVPVKPLRLSKMRLAHLLSVEERVELVNACLRRSLTVLAQSTSVQKTLVVSSDEIVLDMARRQGVGSLDEGESDGLNNAVNRGVREATRNHATDALILPADLPLIRVEDVEMMTHAIDEKASGAARREAVIRVCSDTKRDGTNALLLRLPTQFTFQYGPGSFPKHLLEAARLGISAHIIRSPGLEFDLDTEADWEKYRRGITHAIDL